MPFSSPEKIHPGFVSYDIADLSVGDVGRWTCQSRSSKELAILSWVVEEHTTADGCLLRARVLKNDTPALLKAGELYGFRYMTPSPSLESFRVTNSLLGSGYQWWFTAPAEPEPIECIGEYLRTCRIVGGQIMSKSGLTKIAM